MLFGKIVIWLMAYLLMSQSELLFPQMWAQMLNMVEL